MLTLASEHFGKLIVPDVSIVNEAPGPGQSVATVIQNIHASLNIPIINTNLLKYTPEETEAAANNAASPVNIAVLSSFQRRQLDKSEIDEQFYTGLKLRYIRCLSLSSYVMVALNEHENALLETDAQTLYQVLSYITLLACISTYNALLSYVDSDLDMVNTLIRNIQEWQYILELKHLPHIANPDYIELYNKFFNHFQKVQSDLAKTQPTSSINLSVAELGTAVTTKNKRAEQFGATFHGKIVLESNINHSQTADPNAIARLVAQIESLALPQATQRMQFLFYPTTHRGPVEVIDAQWDPQQRCFNLIHLHASNSTAQYHFLKKLITQLNDKRISHRIIACQTNLSPYSKQPTSVYAYALSGIVSHLSFEKLLANNVFCDQPLFMSQVNHGPVQAEALNVRWIPLHALGKKVVMIMDTSTPERYKLMLAQLAAIFPLEADRINAISSFSKKYSLVLDPLASTSRIYVQDLHQRLKKRHNAANATFDVDEIKNKLGALNNGQALRRATVQSPADEFEYMLICFKGLKLEEDIPVVDSQDTVAGKHFTPLHLALREDKATRAAKLLKLGEASSDIKDDTQAKQTAKELYAQAPEKSEVKNNRVLRGLLS